MRNGFDEKWLCPSCKKNEVNFAGSCCVFCRITYEDKHLKTKTRTLIPVFIILIVIFLIFCGIISAWGTWVQINTVAL